MKKFGFVFLIAALFLSGCAKQVNPELGPLTKPVTITYWRVHDTAQDIAPLLDAYESTHPHVDIRFRQLRPDEYERVLLEAWAEDKGPDIFSIPVTWLSKYESKIAPMPEVIKVAVGRTFEKGIETVTEYQVNQYNTIRPNTMRNTYIDLVPATVVRNNEIYGLPLGFDNLALFYNKEIFNESNILFPPKTWQELRDITHRLTVVNQDGDIVRSGIALGTGENVTRSFDIVSALLMQNGVQMTTGNAVDFGKRYANEAIQTVDFYTSFANPVSDSYAWNDTYPDSVQAFAQGQTAMFIGYNYHIDQIEAISPSLDYGIAPFTQIQGSSKAINHANMTIETVAKKSDNPVIAWDILNYISGSEQVAVYLENTNKLSVLRSMLAEQQQDPDMESFAAQALTSVIWYRGYDIELTESLFEEMIDNFRTASLTFGEDEEAGSRYMRNYNTRVQQTYVNPISF